MENKINIVLSSSKEYSKYANVMLYSLLSKNSDSEICIYWFYNDNSIDWRCCDELAQRYNAKLYQVKVPEYVLNKAEEVTDWPKDVWYRWYAFDYLKGKVDRFLVLGVDTFINGDISEFYFQTMDTFWFGLCQDMNFASIDQSRISRRMLEEATRANVNIRTNYYNCDVTLVNMQNISGKISYNSFLDLFLHNRYMYADQDVLTYDFRDKIKCQTAHCGRCEQHFIVGAFTSPTVRFGR